MSALLGPCYGSSTWYACLSDFVVMRRGATMAVASGRVTSKAIRQEIDSEELGGWRMHTQSTGLVDALAETDEEALEIVKKWLAYFPSNQNEPPPRQAVTPESVPDTGRSCSTCRPTATRSMTCARRSTASSTATA